MSDLKRIPYQRGITLEEAREEARTARVALAEAREEARAARAALEDAQARLDAAIPGAVNVAAEGRSSSPPRPIIRPHGTQQMPVAGHDSGGLSFSNNMSIPTADTSVDPYVTQSPGGGGPNKNDTRLGQDTNRSRGLPGTHPANYSRLGGTYPANYFGVSMDSGGTSGNIAHEYANIDPALRSNSSTPTYGGPGYLPDPYQNNSSAPHGPANNTTSNGFPNSNGVHVPIAIPARFATQYVSPYTQGSVRYFGAMGYPHGRGRTVGELVPGHAATSPSPCTEDSQIYEYPEAPEYGQPYNDQESTNESSVAETTPSNVGGSQIYRPSHPGQEQSPSEEYLDPNQYLSYLMKISPELYNDSPVQATQAPSMVHDGISGLQRVASHEEQTFASCENQAPNQTHREVIVPVDNRIYQKPVEKRAYRKSNRKRMNGTLYDKHGHLPFPLEHYREYMNGQREMNGKRAEPELAPIPCKSCVENGLTCRKLSRKTDYGEVFTRMRRPWRDQEVSNYIVCANCWVASKPQCCSFWRRPEGKEEPARRYIRWG